MIITAELAVLFEIYASLSLFIFYLTIFTQSKLIKILVLILGAPIIYLIYFIFIGVFAIQDGDFPIKVYLNKTHGVIQFTKDYINGDF